MQSCGKVAKVDTVSMKWSSFDLDLPDGIEVYIGTNREIPLKAWVAKVDLSHESISVKVLSSNDKDQRDTPMQFLKENNARIIINGGYFNSEIGVTQALNYRPIPGTFKSCIPLDEAGGKLWS